MRCKKVIYFFAVTWPLTRFWRCDVVWGRSPWTWNPLGKNVYSPTSLRSCICNKVFTNWGLQGAAPKTSLLLLANWCSFEAVHHPFPFFFSSFTAIQLIVSECLQRRWCVPCKLPPFRGAIEFDSTRDPPFGSQHLQLVLILKFPDVALTPIGPCDESFPQAAPSGISLLPLHWTSSCIWNSDPNEIGR